MSRAASAPLRADIAVRRHALTVTAAFEAAPGERWAVMGPSGAGKTTILEAIAGLAPLSAGSVRLGDEVISSPTRQAPPQRRGTVLLRQDPCLFPHLSARENVAFGMRSRGVSRGRSRSVADEWLDRVGLGGAGSRSPRELSGGQQQRVALARALAADPRVVLLDEPFTALDPETAASLRTVLADQLRASGTTSVLVTHDALDAAAVADRLLVMERGAVTQSGAVREVLRAPATPFGATIAGLNRVAGTIAAGRWRSGGMSVTTDRDAGTAVVFVRPGDVRLGDPVDSASVSWRSSVVRLEPTVAGVRVFVAELAVDVAVTAAADLRPGSEVRLWVDPGALTWA